MYLLQRVPERRPEESGNHCNCTKDKEKAESLAVRTEMREDADEDRAGLEVDNRTRRGFGPAALRCHHLAFPLPIHRSCVERKTSVPSGAHAWLPVM